MYNLFLSGIRLLVQREENPDGELSVHDGEEFIYVLEGTVAMQIGEDRFDLDPGDCEAEVKFSAPVTPGVTSILVAVDEDTTDESLDPQVWAIVDASDTPLPLIEEMQ